MIAGRSRKPIDSVANESTLREGLELDSTALFVLARSLQDEFQCCLPAGVQDGWTTVADVIRSVERAVIAVSVIAAVAEIGEVAVGQLSEGTQLVREIEGWDSFRVFQLSIALENELGLSQPSNQEVRAWETIGDVIDAMATLPPAKVE